MTLYPATITLMRSLHIICSKYPSLLMGNNVQSCPQHFIRFSNKPFPAHTQTPCAFLMAKIIFECCDNEGETLIDTNEAHTKIS